MKALTNFLVHLRATSILFENIIHYFTQFIKNAFKGCSD